MIHFYGKVNRIISFLGCLLFGRCESNARILSDPELNPARHTRPATSHTQGVLNSLCTARNKQDQPVLREAERL
jgi:hypothetical protein